MEKDLDGTNRDKIEEKSQSDKKKEKPPTIHKPLVSFIGLPGPHLSVVFKHISRLASQELNEFDLAKLNIIDNITGFYAPYAPIKSGDCEDVNRTDISTALPSDVLYMLASYVHPRDCLQILLVNKKFYQIFNVPSVWKKYCLARGVENCSSLTINECKKLLFEEHWTFVHERIYKPKKKNLLEIRKTYLCHDIWTLQAMPLDTYLKNYHYMRVEKKEDLVFFVIDVSKYDTEVTEPDGTKINYIDKCQQVMEQIAKRPFGPITKKQHKQASGKKKGLGRVWQDFFYPHHFAYIVATLIGVDEFKAKVLRDPNFPVAVHEDLRFARYFLKRLTSNIRKGSEVFRFLWGCPHMGAVSKYYNQAYPLREMIEVGLIKVESNF